METTLYELLQKGGALYQVPGTSPAEAAAHIINSLPESGLDREQLLQAVLEREALMSTAVGHGIALPHPRNPVIADPERQFVTLAFLRESVDWKALDGAPVHAVLLIVSASAKLHLRTLSRVNFFCQQEPFRRLLGDRAPLEDIIAAVRGAEQNWK